MKKNILICGGSGFIGHHLARKLRTQGHYVVVADIKQKNEYSSDYYTEYECLDLTLETSWEKLSIRYRTFDEVYQLAADMGGAGYIFTGEHDLNVMLNSAQINLHAVKWALKWKAKIFYSSSACMYPSHNQEDPDNPLCAEDSAYPANPDSEYGWEKLFSERLYLAANRNEHLDVRVARFHNIYGPEGTYEGGREKAPAAMCRKVATAPDGGRIEVWGPGNQTRSFLYIDDCVEAVLRLMDSDFLGPINIGSEEMISINDLAKMVIDISGKDIKIVNVEGPVGVMGRNSDNKLIREKLQWDYSFSLKEGLSRTYEWISERYEL